MLTLISQIICCRRVIQNAHKLKSGLPLGSGCERNQTLRSLLARLGVLAGGLRSGGARGPLWAPGHVSGGRVAPWLGHCLDPLAECLHVSKTLSPCGLHGKEQFANPQQANLRLSYPTRNLRLQKPAPGSPRAQAQKALLWARAPHLLVPSHHHRGTCGWL